MLRQQLQFTLRNMFLNKLIHFNSFSSLPPFFYPIELFFCAVAKVECALLREEAASDATLRKAAVAASAAAEKEQKLASEAEKAKVSGLCSSLRQSTLFKTLGIGDPVKVCAHSFCRVGHVEHVGLVGNQDCAGGVDGGGGGADGRRLCGFGFCCKCNPKEHLQMLTTASLVEIQKKYPVGYFFWATIN
jgi:hypothetical protein